MITKEEAIAFEKQLKEINKAPNYNDYAERGPNDLEARIDDLLKINVEHHNLNADLRKEIKYLKERAVFYQEQCDQLKKENRELRDMGKESLFNLIENSNKYDFQIDKSNILDLFSGVGSFGIECLSRGAKNVVFVENYYGVLPILKKNLYNLKSVKNYKIIE